IFRQMNIKQKLHKAIKGSLNIEVELTEPKIPQLGDYSTSIAFTLAKQTASPPREVAQELVSRIKLSSEFVDRVEVGGTGFINFWLNKNFIYESLAKILEEGERFGSSNLGNNKKILVEFVSANPTGPLVVVSGRAAAIGDSLVRILNFAGYQANSEYYIDNCGRQIKLLEESIRARYKELDGEKAEIPEGGYPGEYIKEIAREFKKSQLHSFREYGVNSIVKLHKASLEKFGVKFDNWVYESDIRKSGGPQKVIDLISKKGLAYKKDGALWLRMQDGKDKVLIKSDGEFAYLVPDIAYHLDKFSRGYDLLIDLFGPDHIAHIDELKAGLSACDAQVDKLKVIIVQWVTLIKEGKKIGMSKRKGEFITLDEVIDEVGKDVSRFFFLMRKCESHLDFDIELAKRESKENPVYYVQYASARIASILRLAREQEMQPRMGKDGHDEFSLLKTQEELLIMRKLIHFPEIVEHASLEFSPHYIPFYLLELATLFHNFYEKHRVISEDMLLTQARIGLVKAARQIIKIALSLMGISAPEKM
ncbi:arginine--tRNA ligase, partial [candidate division WOR-3 bacterium]|nr:arginine--tRNA ligase [candidate division WOR-3 bacterium]